jgi:hypothetical protein
MCDISLNRELFFLSDYVKKFDVLACFSRVLKQKSGKNMNELRRF